ncbi:prophage PhiRv1 protein, partial [Mycobacterium tuberculosis TKK_04_0005]
MGRKLSRRNKWRRWPPDRGAGAAESQAAAARGAGSWPPGSIFWLGAHGLQTRIRASFDENRHCYRRSPRHLRRHLPAAQTNRQRNPQRRQRNPPVRGETNGAAGRRIAELERPKAKERQREGGRLG